MKIAAQRASPEKRFIIKSRGLEMGKITTLGNYDYNNEIEKFLKQIEGNYSTHKSPNPVGSLLLSAIRASPKDLMLVPMASYGGKGETQCRAIEEPKDKLKAAPKGMGGKDRTDLREKLYSGRQDDPDTDDDERYTTLGPDKVAEGGGSDATVYFTPSEWGGAKSPCSRPGSTPADEVLFHEMVHALRDMQGLSNPVPTVNTSYLNEEEFLAIVVANVYVSAKGGTKFRANHFDESILWSPLNTSKGFVEDENNRKILDYYSSMWQPTFGQLANLTQPKFNPFREVIARKGKRRPVRYRPA
jgi:hypothetical protein